MEFYNEDARFIPILSDYGFKVTFGNESDTRFLRKALQTLINSPVPILEVQFLQNEIKGLTKNSRGAVCDMMCTDESGNQFIVEMQLSEYPAFIQRMQFYTFHRLNTLIRKGRYQFQGLPKVYCIGILAEVLFTNISDYHNIITLRNEKGEQINDQITFITVELAKFGKRLTDVKTDLDKLIYTMKTAHTITEPSQFPPFWDEEWLEVAIKELDTRALTPDQRLAYEMTIASNALAIKLEKQKIEQATNAVKTETVQKALQMGLTVEQAAQLAGVTVEFARTIAQQGSSAN